MKKKYKKKLSTVSLLSIGFFITIVIGTALLWLPFASTEHTRFIDALLTATSATCVTGLASVVTATHWTLFGQIVIIVLIQIGGLGFMTVITLFFMIFRKNIGLYNRTVLMQSAGSYNISSIPKLIKRIVIGTLIFETLGAAIIALNLWPTFGAKSIYYGVFHSISAYCNAGFDVFGDVSLVAFQSNPVILITIMMLIVIGGSGFIVWSDMIDSRFKFSRYQLHTKIVLIYNLILIFVPAILFFIFEFTTIGVKANFVDLSLGDKILNSFFMAVTPRTAGFASVDMTQVTPSGQLLTAILMFIGGNSGSTAGGIKVTTLVVVVATLVANARSQEHIVLFKRRLSPKIVNQSISLFIAYIILILLATITISSYEPFDLKNVLFEVMSAIGTVGLSLGVTAKAQIATKLILIFLMYIGRLGALTLFSVIMKDRNDSLIEKPEGKVLVG